MIIAAAILIAGCVGRQKPVCPGGTIDKRPLNNGFNRPSGTLNEIARPFFPAMKLLGYYQTSLRDGELSETRVQQRGRCPGLGEPSPVGAETPWAQSPENAIKSCQTRPPTSAGNKRALPL